MVYTHGALTSMAIPEGKAFAGDSLQPSAFSLKT
jgi:hypothetical protein